MQDIDNDHPDMEREEAARLQQVATLTNLVLRRRKEEDAGKAQGGDGA